MAIAKPFTLFFLLAFSICSTPAEDLETYKTQRNEILAPLGNLEISDSEAFDQVASNILQILKIEKEETGTLWVNILRKEKNALVTSYLTSEIAFDVKESIHEQLENKKEEIGEAIQAHKEQFVENKAGLVAAIVKTFKDFTEQLINTAKDLIDKDFRNSFNEVYTTPSTETKDFEIEADVSEGLADEVFNWIGDILETLEVDLDDDTGADYENEIANNFGTEYKKYYSETQSNYERLINLCHTGINEVSGEVFNMYALIQVSTNVPADKRLSRMSLLIEFLTLMPEVITQEATIQSFEAKVVSTKKYYLGHPDNVDAEFEGLHKIIYNKLLNSVSDHVSTKIAYGFLSNYFITLMGYSPSHVVPFMHHHHIDEKNILPLLSSESQTLVGDSLKVISVLVGLEFSNVSSDWFKDILRSVHILLNLNVRNIQVWTDMSSMLSEALISHQGQGELKGYLYNTICEFIDLNQEDLDDTNWNIYFDQYINLLFSNDDELAVKYYLQLKTSNVYFYLQETPFDVSFLSSIPNEGYAKTVTDILGNEGYTNTRTLLWNAYKSITGDSYIDSFNSGKYLMNFVNTDVSSTHFMKSTYHITRTDPVQKSTAGKIGGKINVVYKARSERIKEKESLGTTSNKIVVDETPIEENPIEETQNEENIINLIRKNEEVQELLIVQPEPIESISDVVPGFKETQEQVIKDKERREVLQQKIEDIFNEDNVVGHLEELNTPEVDEESHEIVTGVEPNKTLEEEIIEVPKNIVIEKVGELTNAEMKILEDVDALDMIKQIQELVDEDGNVTEFVWVKVVPKNSKCHDTLFGINN